MMVSEGKVHGGNGTSVWQSIKQALPFGRVGGPAQAAPSKPTHDTSKRLEAHSQGAVLGREATERDTNAISANKNGQAASTQAQVQQEAAPQPPDICNFGYARGLEKHYRVDREIARGGNGIVCQVTDIRTGQEWALKSIPKVLSEPNLSERKKLDHVNAIKREVDVMRRMRGFLNVASLEEVFEDNNHVHIVMELCRGGELHHRIGAAHYSERTAASFMRATLRTLAQCHTNKILHRDIKPGNFLLSSEDERAPLKAVDFGLAVFFEEKQLPLTDLGLEGTPWFMAPETLRSEVYPSSDVWSAGVMAHQLITGRFPFDDKANAHSPSLSKVWKSILTDEVDFNRSHWAGISDEAKDFVRMLLNKDPTARPTAREALKHPWLQGTIQERHSKGRPLSLAVVQRIQRFSQASFFKRTVLEMIAEELLAERPEAPSDNPVGDVHSSGATCALGADARPLIDDPSSSPLEYLYERLRLVDRALVDRSALAAGLEEMGYKLSNEEVERLLDQLDPGNTGQVAKIQLAASQMDWRVIAENQTERWLRCARRAFSDLDADKDGLVSVEDMVALLRHKLHPAEVEAAVRQALVEAERKGGSIADQDGSSHDGNGSAGGSTHDGSLAGGSMHGTNMSDPSLRNGLNFRQFMRMLTHGSADSLDLYDDRWGSLGSPDKALSGTFSAMVGSPSSFDRVNLLLERSVKGGDVYQRAAHLDPVPEEK